MRFFILTAPRVAKVEEWKIGLQRNQQRRLASGPGARATLVRGWLSSCAFPRQHPQRRARHCIRKRYWLIRRQEKAAISLDGICQVRILVRFLDLIRNLA